MSIQMNAKHNSQIKPTVNTLFQIIKLQLAYYIFYRLSSPTSQSTSMIRASFSILKSRFFRWTKRRGWFILFYLFIFCYRNIIIGFCNSDQKKDKILGNKKGSYGYQANGKILSNVKDVANGDVGEDFGPKFDEKDVIGCGLLIAKREIFYTKNGAFINTAFKDVKIAKEGFYPAVCIQSLSHHIQSNFGRQNSHNGAPFLFDLDGFCQRECLENFFEICSV